MEVIDAETGSRDPYRARKHVAYDGGSQSSHFIKFDGNYDTLRKELLTDERRHVWNKGVLASHYLKMDTQQTVLIIGSAGGQETKVALAYGAARVDAVEMVGTVVKLGKGKYADYIGNIFNDPRVHVVVGEGRSYLRSSDFRYDIIQMYSNHTSSSIAAGTGAMATTYLQTTDAYKEYFKHLSHDGILHINHHVYSRMIAIAAKAWKELGWTDFMKHVIVYQREGEDNLPSVLIKMTPWNKEEVDVLNGLFLTERGASEKWHYELVENPLNDDEHFIPQEFYSGNLPEDIRERSDYNVFPNSDDQPYFNFFRKSLKRLSVNKDTFVDEAVATLMNSQLRKYNIPMDVIHFVVVGTIALFFALMFILLPLMYSKAGKVQWAWKWSVLGYFSCLGAGFIIIELVLIQLFMKLIGFPLYVYSTVIFTLLLAAGIGSMVSGKLHLERSKVPYPFMGIVIFACIILVGYDAIINLFLQMPLMMRILATAGVIFPLGFFLGMPFPLGMLTLEKRPQGAVAWAWGMNGLFTVVGGLASVLLSIFIGFRVTMVIAVIIYVIALYLYNRIRSDIA
jgi:spermidine synthase